MDRVEKSGVIARWVKTHLVLYTGPTRHPFILSIRDRTIDFSSFKRWLGQDYIFVREFVPFAASVLLKASKNSDDNSDMEVILSGLASLSDEISWFKQEAAKWDVPLSDVVVHKSNQNYCRFLESLMLPAVEYCVVFTALWAIETVYQESFSHCLEAGRKTPPELLAACKRWGREGFGEFCRSLKKIVNRCLEKAADEALKKAEVTFLHVLGLEIEFWDTSHGGPK
uniref:aminopyrimidine aminohydrolase n=1 Tax=Populus tomentosa TaxID=118781 RepID=R4TXG7_POPTO|nr:PM36 [Populus tomentosa]